MREEVGNNLDIAEVDCENCDSHPHSSLGVNFDFGVDIADWIGLAVGNNLGIAEPECESCDSHHQSKLDANSAFGVDIVG